jgi:putative membrane protein
VERRDAESSHRTHLAAERTWLAWWRTALAAAAAGLGVGRLLPEVTSGTTWPYVVLGSGYSVVAVGLMLAGGIRQGRVRDALGEESFVELDRRLVTAFTVAGALLTAATLAVVVASA